MQESGNHEAHVAGGLDLRQAAEERLQQSGIRPAGDLRDHDVSRMVHELHVHQIELEMQNEELRRRQQETDDALERYRDLYEFSPTGYLTLERDGKISRLNLTAARILGYDRSRLLGRRFPLFVTDADRPAFNDLLGRVFDDRSPRSREVTALREDQRPVILQIEASYSPPDQACSVIAIDVTARRQAEADWRISFEAVSEAMFVVDPDGTIQRCNEVLCDLLHQPYGQILGRKCFELLHGSDTFVADCPLQAVLQTRQRKTCELYLRDRWFQVSVDPIFDASGAIRGTVNSLADITEKKRMEVALRVSEARYRSLLDLANDAIFVADAETGKLLDGNQKALKLTGRSLEELRGLPQSELHPPEEAKLSGQLFRQVVGRGQGVTRQLHVLDAGGRQVSVEISANLIQTGGQAIVLGIFRDITERRQAEEALKAAHERLRATLQAIPDLLFEVDRDGRILDYHVPVYDVLYVSAPVFVGRTVGEVLPSDAAQAILQALLEADQKGWHRGATYALDMPDGRRWFELSIAAKRERPEVACRFTVLARDITARKQAEEALRKREALLAEAQSIAHLGIWRQDLLTDELRWSEEISRIFGWPPEQPITYQQFMKFIHPEDAHSLQAAQHAARNGDRVLDCEYRIVRSDGEIRWLMERCKFVRDVHGRLVALEGVVLDLTTQRRAEEAAFKSTAILQAVNAGTTNVICVKDREGKVIMANPAMQRFLGKTEAELIGHSDLGLVATAEDAQAIRDTDRRIMESGTSETLEESGVSPAGPWTMLITKSPLRSPHGEIVGVIGVGADITQRKRAEEALAASQRMLAAHIDNTPLAVIEFDAQFRIIRWSAAAERIFGWTAAEVVGRVASDIRWLPEDEAQPIGPELAALLSGRQSQAVAVGRNYRKDGSVIHCEWHNSAICDAQGDVISILALVLDVTERDRSAAALVEAREAAEDANQAKSQFLANISHELRTPMSAVLGMLELALRDQLPPKLQEHLRLAKNAADVQLDLLNEILDFSRIESGKITLETVDFNLRTLLDQTVKVLGVRAHEKGLELCCDLPRQVPIHLIGDPLRLRQILTNLIGNAIKFTETGEVLVRVAVESQTAQHVVLRFSVRDTGIGISREDQETIFAPFSQGDASTTRRYGGTGLGLTIARALVEMMDGRLSIESELGRGSTLTFTAQFRPQPEVSQMQPLELAFLAELRDLRALVIDRHATNRQIICDMLAGWTLQPEAADSVSAALVTAGQSAAAGRPFRLLILDAESLAGEVQALDEYLRQPRPQRLATILMHPYGSLEALGRCRPFGTSSVPLEKPVSQTDLFLAILRSLGLAAPVSQAPSATPGPTSAARSLRILVADDTPTGRILVGEILKERGHAVQMAENGREAFELVRDQEFDVVLMDVQMPEMDGFQATAAIRALPQLAKSQLPIVALTAHARREDERQCLAAGMNAYLSKPIKSAALIELVEGLAEQDPASCSESAVSSGEACAPECPGPVAGETPVIDRAEALHRSSRPDWFPKIIDYFLAERPNLLEQMRAGFRDGNAEAVAHAAHRFVNIVGYLDAPATLEAARQLEQTCHAGLAGAPEVYAQLERQAEILAGALATDREPGG